MSLIFSPYIIPLNVSRSIYFLVFFRFRAIHTGKSGTDILVLILGFIFLMKNESVFLSVYHSTKRFSLYLFLGLFWISSNTYWKSGTDILVHNMVFLFLVKNESVFLSVYHSAKFMFSYHFLCCSSAIFTA